MKKIGSIIAVLAFVSAAANAEVKYNGQLDLHGYYATNTNDADSDANDKITDNDYRANLGLSFDAGEEASVNVNIIKVSGSDNVEFGQAYVELNKLLGIDHKIGRQFYGDQGDLVIYYGPDYWYISDMGYNSIEGWNANYKMDKLAVNALIAKENEYFPGNKASNKDVNLYGLKVNYKVNDLIDPTIYYYDRADNSGTAMDRLDVYGAKINGKYDALTYGVEYAMNDGKDKNTLLDYDGHALKINLGYGLDLAGKFDISAEYVNTSGDDNLLDSKDKNFYGISSNYNPGYIWSNQGYGISDLTTWNIGFNWTPAKVEKLNLGLKYYNFAPTEDRVGYDTYGNEIDFTAKWAYSDKTTLGLYCAMFMIDSDYARVLSLTNDDTATQVGLFASVKF